MKTNEIDAVAEIGADMLRGVRGFLERGWTQKAYARRNDGFGTSVTAPDATCWCLVGAACAVNGGSQAVALALGFEHASHMLDWNDEPGRTQAEVLARIDQALERAGGGE